MYIDPDRDAWAIFKDLPRDEPIQMLNLVKLKARAEYPQGHPDHGKDMTGLDAYRAYGRTTAHIFKRVGGRQVWAGKPQVMVTGPQSEAWDLAFIADAALWLKATQPELGIDNPYMLTQEQFDYLSDEMSRVLGAIDTILTAADDPSLTEVVESGSRELIRTTVGTPSRRSAALMPAWTARLVAAMLRGALENAAAHWMRTKGSNSHARCVVSKPGPWSRTTTMKSGGSGAYETE